MILPDPIGPISEIAFAALRESAESVAGAEVPVSVRPLSDDDLHLALNCLYNVHYDGFDHGTDRHEWHPVVLDLRGQMEEQFLSALRERYGGEPAHESPELGRDELLRCGAEAAGADSSIHGVSLSEYVESRATPEDFRELLIHRSIYQLKEADAHTWGIPRVRGGVKSGLVAIQADEYGFGEPGEAHAEVFARLMRRWKLDSRPGAYLKYVPGSTLATDNLVSLFGLHRNLRWALVGHLAYAEITSSAGMKRYSRGLRRLSKVVPDEDFFQLHADVDDSHAKIAVDLMLAAIPFDDLPAIADVKFGVRALVGLSVGFANAVIAAWQSGTTSLRMPHPSAARG